jgi:protein-arginine kinase activator protein McsA
MRVAAKALEFERAATIRDEIRSLEQRAVGLRAEA